MELLMDITATCWIGWTTRVKKCHSGFVKDVYMMQEPGEAACYIVKCKGCELTIGHITVHPDGTLSTVRHNMNELEWRITRRWK